MNRLAEVISQVGPMWLVGTTILLTVGCLIVVGQRGAVCRQRAGEWCVGATLVWVLLSVVPLPRWDGPRNAMAGRCLAVTSDDVRAGPPRSSRGFELGPVAPDSSGDAVDTQALDTLARRGDAEGTPASVATDDERAAGQAGWRAVWRRLTSAVFVWGAGLFLFFSAIGRLALTRLEAVRVPVPRWLQSMYDELPKTRAARLLVSGHPSARPLSYGLLRPTILLPRSLCRRDNRRLLRHVLLHEQAHADRRDTWGAAVLNLAFPFLYMNPLYWWLRRAVRFSRELIADERAATKGSREEYASDLLELMRSYSSTIYSPVTGLGTFRFRNEFARRMEMLIDRERPLSRSTSLAWRLSIGLVLLATVATLASVLGVDAVSARALPAQEASPSATTATTDDAVVSPPERSGHGTETAANEGNESGDKSNSNGEKDPAPEQKVFGRLQLLVDINVPTRREGLVMMMLEDGSVVSKGDVVCVVKWSALSDAGNESGGEDPVRAAVHGLIVETNVKPGEWVKRGDPICRLVQLDKMVVEGSLPQASFRQQDVKRSEAKVTVRVARDENVVLHGSVGFVSPFVNENSGLFRFRVVVDNFKQNGNWVMRPGMLAEISLTGPRDAEQPQDEQETTEPRSPASAGDAERRSESRPREYSEEEIEHLAELVKRREQLHELVAAKWKQGVAGAGDETAARRELHLAQAELARARGETKTCLEQCRLAVQAAGQNVVTLDALYKSGNATLESVLNAQARLAEVQLKLIRLKRDVE